MKKFFGDTIKRFLLKIIIKYNRIISYKPKHYTDNEIKSSAIFRKLINHPDSSFIICPLSNERYIKNEKLGVFLWASYMRLKITNQVYHYDIKVHEELSNKLEIMFNKKLEVIGQEFKVEMESQFQQSLKKILKLN